MKTAFAQVFEGVGRPQNGQRFQLPQTPGNGEILVQVDLATICGSDLHTVKGHRQQLTPCVLGHEGVGHVIELGAERLILVPGDRITWCIADSCGKCSACAQHSLPEKCQALFKYGHAPLSDGTGLNGAYASHMLLREGTHVVKVPDILSDAVVAPANCALA